MNARWRSAYEAVRKPEAKSATETALLHAMLRGHPTFASMEDALLTEIGSVLDSLYAHFSGSRKPS